MNVNITIANFISFLNAGYPAWRRAAEVASERDREFLDEAFNDWAQANWELLVERTLCGIGEFLEIYAAGSDYEAQSYSRVFFHDALPTHEIVCQAAEQRVAVDLLSEQAFDPERCSFDRFVCYQESWYANAPPFDHVLLESGNSRFVTPVSAVTFLLRPVGLR